LHASKAILYLRGMETPDTSDRPLVVISYMRKEARLLARICGPQDRDTALRLVAFLEDPHAVLRALAEHEGRATPTPATAATTAA